MSQLADLLETHAEGLWNRWLQRLGEAMAKGGGSESPLIDHAPDLLRELQAALRPGQSPTADAVRKTPSRPRYRIGFSIKALVRETALLSECILDLAEETSTSVTLSELRVLNNFIASAVAEGISEHEQYATELRKRPSEFEQQILGAASHDLRNPLGVIQMGATVLSCRHDLDEFAQRTVARIQSSARRATSLVSDLLDFTQARLGAGIRINPMPADLHAVTQVMAAEAAVAYPTRQVEVMSSGNGKGHWDANRIGQVVKSLVTNALKYSVDGTLVQVETRGESDNLTLSVHNQGKLLPAEWIRSIFQATQFATDKMDNAGPSMMLGLYVAKCIVDAHRGRMDVVSTADAGTTFTMWLPRTGGLAP